MVGGVMKKLKNKDNEILKYDRDKLLEKYDYFKNTDLLGFMWEFIRRNEEYKKTYEECFLHPPGHFFNYDPVPLKRDNLLFDLERTWRRNYPYRKIFEFGLEYPLDPDKKANDKHFKATPLKSYFKWSIKLLFSSFDDLSKEKYFDELKWVLLQNDNLGMLIDIDAPIDKIKFDIERVIEIAKEQREHLKKEFSGTPVENEEKEEKKRIMKNEWPDYLIAYDLKESGYKTIKIAQILFPNEDNSYPGFIVSRKINNCTKSAKKLINGGYKKYLSKLTNSSF
tara:strand:- start:95 stop:937 length:843 start_codon:yes stop_codon:yes gene_type:complete